MHAPLGEWSTSTSAQRRASAGEKPQQGELGVIAEGSYADLVLVDGNPLDNIDLIADPHENFVLIMKDGVIYKNTIE